MLDRCFKFLDIMHPNLFRLRTKWDDDIPHYNRPGSFFLSDMKSRDVKKLCNTFGISILEGVDIYNRWWKSKPVYIRVNLPYGGYKFEPVPEDYIVPKN